MIVLALVALFAISWFPWYAHKLALLNGFSLPSNGCKDLQNAVRILSYCNSALNPYFYRYRFCNGLLQPRTRFFVLRDLLCLVKLQFHCLQQKNACVSSCNIGSMRVSTHNAINYSVCKLIRGVRGSFNVTIIVRLIVMLATLLRTWKKHFKLIFPTRLNCLR